MQLIRIWLSVCLLWLTLPAGAADVLTEDSVEALFDRIVAAHERRDFDKMLSYYSPDAEISWEVPDQLKTGDFDSKTMGVEELRKDLKTVLGLRVKHEYEILSMKITLEPSKEAATLEYTTRSSWKNRIQMTESLIESKMYIRLIKGKPKVVRSHNRYLDLVKKGS